MSAHWRAFDDELARWREDGRTVDFWWRDDDACRAHPALTRLLALASGAGVPLGLAVIPLDAAAGVFDGLPQGVAVLQHGCDHRNRAPAGGRKCESPDTESRDDFVLRLATVRRALLAATNGRALPVLVPPWNRLGDAKCTVLPGAGYTGLSRFGARKVADPGASLAEVNTHVDLIDWRGSRGFAGEAAVLTQAARHLAARREGRDASGRLVDPAEPTGWLSHHLVHDAAVWAFLETLFERTRRHGSVRWLHPEHLFPAV